MKNINLVIITLDSLRYDVAIEANTPNLKSYFEEFGKKCWDKAYAQGTYTLPSHISMFSAGKLPDNRGSSKPILNHSVLSPFGILLPWERNKNALYTVPQEENIVKGFREIGYSTIGIGGVAWFNSELPTSNFWEQKYFEEFYWSPDFLPKNTDSYKNQLKLLKNIFSDSSRQKPYFLFLNIAATHSPYMNFGISKEGQQKALEQVDIDIPFLFKLLPKPFHLFIMADHGDCFGEDGNWGHGFYHPKIMEVPFSEFIVN